MYLLRRAHFQILALRRQIEHGRSCRRRESLHSKRAVALTVLARHAQIVADSTVQPPASDVLPAQSLPSTACATERLAKHARQLETHVAAHASCHSPPRSRRLHVRRSSPPTPGVLLHGLQTDVLEACLQRVLRRAGSLQRRSNSNVTIARACPSRSARADARALRSPADTRAAARDASSTIRSALPLAFDRAVCAARPLRPRSAAQPRGSRCAPCSRFDSVARHASPTLCARSAESRRGHSSAPAGGARAPARRVRHRSLLAPPARARSSPSSLSPCRRATAPRPATQSSTRAARPRHARDRPAPPAARAAAPRSVPLHLDACHDRSPAPAMHPAARRPSRPGPARAIDAERRHELRRVLERTFDRRAEFELAAQCVRQRGIAAQAQRVRFARQLETHARQRPRAAAGDLIAKAHDGVAYVEAARSAAVRARTA